MTKITVDDETKEPLSFLAKIGLGLGGTSLITFLLVAAIPFGLSNWDKIWTRADKVAARHAIEQAQFKLKVQNDLLHKQAHERLERQRLFIVHLCGRLKVLGDRSVDCSRL